MSENNDEENTIRIKRVTVRQGASQEEKKAAIGEQVFNQMVGKIVENCEKRGIPIKNVDDFTTEDVENYSQILRKLQESEEISAVSSKNRQGETTEWGDNLDGISRSQRSYDNEGRTYSSIESMIRDLRAQSRDKKDVVKSAEAEAILAELWKKYGKALHDNVADPSKRTLPLSNYEEPKGKEKKIRQLQNEGA